MKIIMLHDLDTGGMAAALKPTFKELGHDIVVMQTVKTYLDGEGEHIDYHMAEMSNEDLELLKDEFKDTDLFIIRSITDITLRLSGIIPYLNNKNMIYRVHGSELREKGVPYTLRTWTINWYGKEPVVVGPRDPSLLKLYKGEVITHIERPLNIGMFKGLKAQECDYKDYALTTPTNLYRKGTDVLMDAWKDKKTPLQVLSGVPRREVLEAKIGASYYIDRIGEYEHGPYGMNSVEAWYLRVPVFSQYRDIDVVVCPELPILVNNVNIKDVEKVVNNYIYDDKSIEYAYRYAINTHNPTTIAQQYIALGRAIGSR